MQWPREEWYIQKRPIVISAPYNMRLRGTRKLRCSQLMTLVMISVLQLVQLANPTRGIDDILQYNCGALYESQKQNNLYRHHHKNLANYPIFLIVSQRHHCIIKNKNTSGQDPWSSPRTVSSTGIRRDPPKSASHAVESICRNMETATLQESRNTLNVSQTTHSTHR